MTTTAARNPRRASRRPPGRPRSADPAVAVPARIPRSMLGRLDALLAERRRADPALTRQDVLREAVARLVAAEARKARRAGG